MSTREVREPQAGLAARPLLCALLATRPAYLNIAAVGVAIGWACATRADVKPDTLAALVTLKQTP